MKVTITGSSGLIGTALICQLEAEGHRVRRLVRQQPREAGEFRWDPTAGEIDMAGIDGVDAIVNLAGANIAEGRWTDSRRRLIRESRVQSTRLLAQSIMRATSKPRVFISGSAIGFYGDRGDGWITESCSGGQGFLPEVCRDWETEAESALECGVRLVCVRTGVVLSPSGGALRKLLPVFRSGLGGRIGSGETWMSWISIDDAVRSIIHALSDERLRGPVNVVAPNPVTNKEFTVQLGRALRRPVYLPIPAFALRMALGRMADETVLVSARVVPAELIRTGFAFKHPEIGPALISMVGRRD